MTYTICFVAIITFLAAFKPESNFRGNKYIKTAFKWGLPIVALFLALMQIHFQNRIDDNKTTLSKQKDSIVNSKSDSITRLNLELKELSHEQLDTTKIILKYTLKLNAAYEKTISLQDQIKRNGLEQLDTSKIILRYSQKLNEQYAKNAEMQKQLTNYMTGDTTIPIIGIWTYRKELHWFIYNTGSSPLWNVKIKYSYYEAPMYHYLPEINFFPPGFRKDLVTDYGRRSDYMHYTFYVLYNNGKYLEVRFNVTEALPNIWWENLNGKYYNRNGKEIKPKLSHQDSMNIFHSKEF